MEKAPASDSHAPNTSGAVVEINDLFIDLRFPEEAPVTVENCPHSFTMIGYVSAMRQRNPEATNPFPGRDLPPLPVQNRPRHCPLCGRNDGASTSANGETAPTPNNISTTLNEVSGDDVAVVPIQTPESPTPLPLNEETVPEEACNADAEMEPTVEAAANTDTDLVIDDQTIEMNTDSGVGNHQENVDDAGEMNVEGNGTDDDDFQTLSELQARSLRRLRRVENTNSIAVPERVEPVPPVEVEETNNDQNQEQVSSDEETGTKTRLLSELFKNKESGKSLRVTEDECSTAYHSRLVDSSGTTTSRINGQVLGRDVGPSSNRTRTNRRSRQDGEGSSSRRPVVAARTDEAGPSSRGNEASTSRGQANNGPSGSGLRLGNKTDRLKRKAEKSPAVLVTKKTKPGPLRISEPNARSGGSRRYSLSSTMSVSNSFRSPSEVAGPSNVLSNDQSFRETGIIINNNVPPSESQIPVSTIVNDLNENIIPQASEQNLVRRTQLLDLNESDPTERETVQEKENEGPSRLNNDVVQDSSDDIPMDIVELMARNQYERTLANVQSQSVLPPRNVDDIRRLLDLHDMRSMDRRPAVGSSGSNCISFRNPRDGMNIPTTSNGAGRYKFTANPQYQQPILSGRQFSSAVRIVPQRGVVLEPSSFPPRPSVMPFNPNSVPEPPRPAPRPGGITISDIRANELRNRLEGPSDRYTNDTIPALQLLSLMNGNSIRGDTSRSRDNAVSPPGFHPNFNQDRRRGFVNEFCSINRNPAEFSTPEDGNEYTVHGDEIRLRNSRSGGASGSNSQRKGKGIAGMEKRANNEP